MGKSVNVLFTISLNNEMTQITHREQNVGMRYC